MHMCLGSKQIHDLVHHAGPEILQSGGAEQVAQSAVRDLLPVSLPRAGMVGHRSPLSAAQWHILYMRITLLMHGWTLAHAALPQIWRLLQVSVVVSQPLYLSLVQGWAGIQAPHQPLMTAALCKQRMH